MMSQQQYPGLRSQVTGFADLVESSMIYVRPDWTPTVGYLLQCLDLLRRRLAVRRCGTQGAFAGYDRLEITVELGHLVGWVSLTARVVDVRERTHTVELTADLVSSGGDSSRRTLVHGTGRTLHVTV